MNKAQCLGPHTQYLSHTEPYGNRTVGRAGGQYPHPLPVEPWHRHLGLETAAVALPHFNKISVLMEDVQDPDVAVLLEAC